MSGQIVPTLLIGLGGIGSEVVERVYDRVPEDRRRLIAVHAFDTNVNDMHLRAHLQDRMTQTSTDWTVGMYLAKSDESVLEWFPFDIPELRRKLLTDGAGQIRFVSRLAYRAAIQRGKLRSLQEQIRDIFAERGDPLTSSIRVIIVTSLAGGTGAGIFLQTALYIRELLRDAFHKQAVLVRGAFLLPDALILTGALDPLEYDNVRANAYASLKELYAITLSAGGRAVSNRGVTIELEYKPDQKDAEGRQDHAIKSHHLPYDFCFFYDFENSRGKNLGELEHYKDQMARTIFMQLFSPLSNKLFSAEDNSILQVISEEGKNRYGGSGIAALIYPYDEVVEYCTLRWAEESLSNEWGRLDRDFEAEMNRYDVQVKAGLSALKPDPARRYVSLLENYAKGERAHPFFSQMYRSAMLLDEQGRPERPKADSFIESVSEWIHRVVDGDEAVKDAEESCTIDYGRLSNREHARRETDRMELALEVLQERVNRAIEEHKLFIVNQVVRQDCDMPDAAGGDESYRLSTWMLERSEPLHPVAVRYFLYQVSLKLTQHLEELASRNRNLKEHIIRYDRAYDLPETEEVETVQDRLRAALDQSLFRRAFHNQFKELTGEYQEKAERQLRRLREYKVSKLTEEVYDDILKAIATMLKKWEDYFHGLREIQIQLSGEIDLRAREHEGRSNPTAVHVLSSREDKERLWEEQRSSLTIGRDLPPEIRERIYRGRYREFCRDHYEKGPATAGSDNTAKLFREEIFGWCRKTIQELGFLDFNVVKAIRTEALLRGIDPESHLKERVGNLDRRAWPFVPDVSELARSQSYWGIHTDCAHEVSEQDRREIFGQPVEIIVDEAFCRYEVVRYRAHYNLSATDFPKFSAGDSQSAESRPGAYFLSYKKRILDLTMAGNTVSPHLDKRWHLPAYMPDLNRSIADLDQLKIDRAFVLGLVHGRLRSGSVDQRDVWEYYGESGRKFVVVGDRRIPGRYHDLYEAMHHNPAIVDGILDYAEAEWERGLGIKDVLDHAFCKGSRNVNGTGDPILESIFRFLEEVPHEDLQEKTEHLLNRCLGEMEHYFLNAYGSHRRNEAGATLSRFIGELCEGSKTYQAARLDGSEAYRGWRECIDQFTKTLLTTSGVEPSQPLHSPE